jgi:hypothetical protein
MSETATDTDSTPFMQRLYNRIWLLAIAAFVFFLLSYVGWGLFDILAATPR